MVIVPGCTAIREATNVRHIYVTAMRYQELWKKHAQHRQTTGVHAASARAYAIALALLLNEPLEITLQWLMEELANDSRA